MESLFKQVIGCALASLAAIVAGIHFDAAWLGLWVGSVPLMTAIMLVIGWYEDAERECFVCGRSREYGRFMLESDWYRQGDDECPQCCGRLAVPGDRVHIA